MHRPARTIRRWTATLAVTATATAAMLVPATAQAQESTAQLVARAEQYAPAAPAAKPSVAPRLKLSGNSATILGKNSQVTLTALDARNSLVRAKPDGVQALTVLRKGSTARYQLTLPKGQQLRSTPTGAYLVTDRTGKLAYGLVRAPWAVDANGKRLATSYQVQGRQLLQTVATKGAAYPIVTDPWLSWYWGYVNLNFSRGDTAWLASYSDYWQLASAICALAPGWIGVICGLVVGYFATAWAISVKNAARYGQCWYLSWWIPIPVVRPYGALRGWGGFWC